MKRWPLNEGRIWEQAPFLRLLPPLVAGIVVYDREWIAADRLNWVCFGVAGLIIVARLAATLGRGHVRMVSRFIELSALLFACGWGICYIHDVRNDAGWFGNHLADQQAFSATVVDKPAEKEHTWKIHVRVNSAIRHNQWTHFDGDALVYIYKTGQRIPLTRGSVIVLPPGWQPIRNSGNPYEFDYARYANRSSLYYQQFLPLDQIQIVKQSEPEQIPLTLRFHDKGMGILQHYLKEAKVLGLIQAMLMGDDVNLDPDTLQTYSATGIVHIIAISGSHIAVFFLFISACFFWLPHRKYSWVRYLCALPLVWFYVFMAGAPSSAIRSAVMFSLMGIGIFLGKDRNTLNQLFATAFLMLVYDPSWLFALGFQLSFLAVLSLVLFYEPIYRSLPVTSKLGRGLWKIASASIAAEILVAPLVIFYFHLFPIGFLLANIAAWLFMGMILLLGMGIVLFAGVPAIAESLAWLATASVNAFDKLITWLQRLTPELFTHLELSIIELATLFIGIACFRLFIIKRAKAHLFAGLACICCLLLLSIHKEWLALQQEELIVYNIGKATQAELIIGKRYYSVIADTAATDLKKIDYATKETHTVLHAWEKGEPLNDCELFCIGGKTLLILNGPVSCDSGHMQIDYVMVNYPLRSWEGRELKQQFKCNKIILGSGQSTSVVRAWADSCAKYHISLHSTALDGAFVMK